jgi:uncharacterized protein YprB with RNaseH-like and TPR domain
MVAPDRERLRAAFRLPRTPGADPPQEAAEGSDRGVREYLRRRLPAMDPREPASQELAPALPRVELPAGEVATGEHGPFWRRVLRYPLDTAHGRCVLGELLRVEPARIAALAREPVIAARTLRQLLFLDTETTGLFGGAGTVVFAFGFAVLGEAEILFEQLFLRDFGEEEAMLRHVAGRLREHPVPVTFVGKSFDRHRIAARMAVHRIRTPILTAPHVDLYHAARRAFGRQLPDCRLRTVEEHCLGFTRTGDLPGSEAPLAFLQWLRDGTGAVDRVLEHNRLDVLSMVALLGHLAGGGAAAAGRP